MTALLLLWLTAVAAQSAEPLWLDVRVFDGLTDVTEATRVTLYDAGTRANPRLVPLMPNGERQLALPSGRYDVQLLHQDDGRVLGVRWTSLRLLVEYPGAHGRSLEVFNMQPGFGALQLRRDGETAELGTVRWTATLHAAGGGAPVATAVPGDGYLLFVVKPGTYDVAVRTREGGEHYVRGVTIRENLTYLRSWRP